MNSCEVDILIVGGGPAGLLAAQYLAARHAVTVIERGVVGQTAKCWVTTQRRLRMHDLQQCVLSTPSIMTAGTFLGGHLSVSGDFAVVDDHQFLGALSTRCRNRGAHVRENCRLLNLSWTPTRVKAETNQGTFTARLVIDATGGMSLVARTFRLHQIDGFYSVYGAMLTGIRLHSEEIVLGYVSQLGDPPPVLEIFPTSRDSAYCVIFVYSKELRPPQSLAAAFEDHCSHNPYFEITPHTKRQSEKAGAIPIGRRHRKTIPGVTPFGEAGLIQPPLMGTAFNETLEHAQSLCSQITEALVASGDRVASPTLVYPLRKRLQDRIQLPLVREILDGNVERFDRVLRIMSNFPERMLFNFFSNELTWPQVAFLALRLPWLFITAPARLTHGQEAA